MPGVSGGREETPRVRGQGGSREELTYVRGQGRPGEATPSPRPGAAAGRSHLRRGQGRWPGGATRGAVAAQAQEGLEELSHLEGQEQLR